MSLKFNCPGCGKEILVKYLKKGERAKCPHCGELSVIPDSTQGATLQEAAEFAGENAAKFGAPGSQFIENHADKNRGAIVFLRVCAWICIVGGVLFGLIMIITGAATYSDDTEAGPGLIAYGLFMIISGIITGAIFLVISSMADNLLVIRKRVTNLCLIASKKEHAT